MSLGRSASTTPLSEARRSTGIYQRIFETIVAGEFAVNARLPSETELMTSDDRRRLAVKPGITGLWQVSGRSDLDWAESVALDTYYADNWNLSTDVQIAVRTVGAVINAKGAY